MPRTLYWGSGSAPAWRVQVALAEKQLPYDSKKVEFSKLEHKQPAILAVNPRGQVPTFIDEDGERGGKGWRSFLMLFCTPPLTLFPTHTTPPRHRRV